MLKYIQVKFQIYKDELLSGVKDNKFKYIDSICYYFFSNTCKFSSFILNLIFRLHF